MPVKKIWGFHGGDYGDCYFLICDTCSLLRRWWQRTALSYAMPLTALKSRFDPRPVRVRLLWTKWHWGRFPSPNLPVFPCQYHFTKAPYSFINLLRTLHNLRNWQRRWITILIRQAPPKHLHLSNKLHGARSQKSTMQQSHKLHV